MVRLVLLACSARANFYHLERPALSSFLKCRLIISSFNIFIHHELWYFFNDR